MATVTMTTTTTTHTQTMKYFFFFMLSGHIHNTFENKADIDSYVRKVSAEFSRNIFEETSKVTNYKDITKKFESLLKSGQMKLKETDGRKVMSLFKTGIEDAFDKKIKALERIKQKAESAKQKHNDSKTPITCDYLNVHSINRSDEGMLRLFPVFSDTAKVNITNSFVHVPTNVYQCKADILNTVEWTKELDEVFLQNFEEAPHKAEYAFYGDNTGVWRMFPGNVLVGGTVGGYDFFDCRSRVWYVQATASPKDIVIILDVSGSMAGANVGIGKFAARELINSLTEDDYFNVLTVSTNVSYLIPCIKFLIQATKHNKEMFKLAMDKVQKPSDVIKPDLAIEEAFKILYQSGAAYNRSSATCNRAIMFITDGVEGEYLGQKVFEKYNSNKSVRAFGFLVGTKQDGREKDGLIKMTCMNRGAYYMIETYGNVWQNVNRYLQVMSRPIHSHRNQYRVTFSPIYVDCCGAGMVMTLSVPVFNDSKLIGVAGTDLTLNRLMRVTPSEWLGIAGHIFVINNNGFVILHPKLREQSGYLPIHRNIFIEDLEYAVNKSDMVLLKRKMIDQEENGTSEFPIYWLYGNNKKVVETHARFFYEPINGTEYSTATVLTATEKYHYVIEDNAFDIWLKEGLEALNDTFDLFVDSNYTYNVRLAQWKYCDSNVDARTLRRHLVSTTSSNSIPSNCSRELIKRLITPAGIVHSSVIKAWFSLVTNSSTYKKLFVATDTGYSMSLSRFNETIHVHGHLHAHSVFEDAAANQNASLTVSAPYIDSGHSHHEEDLEPVLTISTPVRVGMEQHIVAVSGVNVEHKYFTDIFRRSTSNVTPNLCADHNKHICVLLDRNGFILSSNQVLEKVGRFVGEISRNLIEQLSDVGLFKKFKLDDTQAECPVINKVEKSDANFLRHPIKLLFDMFSMATQLFYWLSIKCDVLSFTSPLCSAIRPSVDDEKDVKLVSCTREAPFFIFQEPEFRKLKTENRTVYCSPNCDMTYYLDVVEGTNMIFLLLQVSGNVPHCKQKCTQLRYKAKPIRKIETDICDSEQRYRRQPNNCHNDIVSSDKCSGGPVRSIADLICIITMCFISLLQL